MDQVVDRLYLWLGLDSKGIDKGLATVENKLAGGLKRIMTGFVAPLAGALAAGKIFGDYTREADELGEFADAMDMSIEDVGIWGEAVKRAGGSMQEFKGGISSLNAGIVQMAKTGGGRLKPFFEELGIAVKDSNGQVRSSFDVLGDLSDRFSKMSRSEAVGFGRKIGVGQGFSVLLNEGRAKLEERLKWAKELGVYTKRDAEIAGKFGDAIDDLGQSFKALTAIAMRLVVPAVSWIAEKMTKLIVLMRQNEPFVLAVLGGIAAIITAKMIPALVKMGAVLLANPATWIFAAIAAAVAAVALAVDDLYAYITGGQSAFASFWSQFGTGAEISEKLGSVWERLKTLLGALLESAKIIGRMFLEAFGPAAISAIEAVGAAIGFLIALAEGDFEGMGQAILNIFSRVEAFLRNVFKGALDFILRFFGTTFDEVYNLITNAFTNAINYVKGLWNDFIGWFKGPDVSNSEEVVDPYSGEVRYRPKTTGGVSDAPAQPPTTGGVPNSGPPAAVNRNVEISHDGPTTINVNTQATDAQGTGNAVAQAVATRPNPYLTGNFESGVNP